MFCRRLTLSLLVLCSALLSAQSGYTDPFDSELDVIRTSMPAIAPEHGFYEQPFTATLHADEGCLIYYTLDGSEPSQFHGSLYQQPIAITTTTVLRARAVSPSEELAGSRIATVTYLFVDDVLKQSNSPKGYPSQWGLYSQIRGNAVADYEMDPELMADRSFAAKCREGLLSLPVISLVSDRDYFFSDVDDADAGGIYIYTDPPTGYKYGSVKDPGTGWTRPVSVEYITADGSRSWQVDCGIKLHGGHSRLPEKCPKHSFRLKFKPEFGPKKLKYPLFDEGEDAAGKLDNIVLRAGFGTTWVHGDDGQRTRATYTRDAWAKKTWRAMGQPSSHITYAHLFINGLYWGIYTPTEHIDAAWCATYYGDTEEDYDVIKVEDSPQEHVTASAGTTEVWEQIFSLAKNASSQKVYMQLQGKDVRGKDSPDCEPLLDMESFIDFMIINIYGGNTDWDNHNWLAFRNRTHPGTGFRMVVWDSERIFESLDTDIGYGKKKHSLTPSYLFEYLLQNDSFCRLVDERISRHCYLGMLSPDSAKATWTALSDRIATALYDESARWGDYRRDVHPYGGSNYQLCTVEDTYQPQQNKMMNTILPKRRDVFVKQMRRYLTVTSLEGPTAGWDGPTEVDVFDLSGQRVQHFESEAGLASDSGFGLPEELDLKPGLYVVRCRQGRHVEQFKIILP